MDKKIVTKNYLDNSKVEPIIDAKTSDWSEPFPDRCYLEVIQRGIPKKEINLIPKVKKFIIGRSPQADGVLDHILVSKFHLQIVYGKNNVNELQFWACDLNSQNKSKINKTILSPNILYVINDSDVIQIAENEFTLILHNPNEKESIAYNTIQAEYSRIGDSDDENVVIDTRKKEREDLSNPVELIKKYFERKGLEPDYEVTAKGEGSSKFTVRLCLTVYNIEGEEMVSEASSIRKNSAIEACARKACEIIEKYDYLFESDIETFEQRNKRKLIENDYYEDDDDAFYDRSGQIENKRNKRMERLGTQDSCAEVLNFETLKAKLDLVQKDILAVFQKISQQQFEIGGDEEEDELDSYMKKIQLEIDQKVLNQYQNEFNNLRKEEEEILKILPKLEPLKLSEEKSILIKFEPLNLKEISKNQKNTTNRQSETLKKTDDAKIIQAPKRDTSTNVEKMISKKTSLGKYSEQNEEYDWIPPESQTGDGLTSLNDKYNY